MAVFKATTLTREELNVAIQMGVLAALAEVLKRMVIPEKHLQEVVRCLRLIKDKYGAERGEKVLPEALFLAIAPPAKTS